MLCSIPLALCFFCHVLRFVVFYEANECDPDTRWYYALGYTPSIPLPQNLTTVRSFSGAASGGTWTGHVFLSAQPIMDVVQFFSAQGITCAAQDALSASRWRCAGKAIPFGTVDVQIEPVALYRTEHLDLEPDVQALLAAHRDEATLVIVTYSQCDTL